MTQTVTAFEDFRDFLAALCAQGELSVAEHGKEFLEVADIPGWRAYDFPELRRTAPK